MDEPTEQEPAQQPHVGAEGAEAEASADEVAKAEAGPEEPVEAGGEPKAAGEETEIVPDEPAGAPAEGGDHERQDPAGGRVGRLVADARAHALAGVGLLAVLVASCGAVVATGGDGSGVRVVESGYSVLDNGDVSYGVVVENTGDEIAYHTVVCVRLDEDDDAFRRGCQPYTVEVLLPGQQVGFGTIDPLVGEEGVTGLTVEVDGPATWEEPGSRGAIVATDVVVAYSPEGDPTISFGQESSYPLSQPVRNPSAYAVLRDSDGEVIGGVGGDLVAPIQQAVTRQTIFHYGPLPGLATAEVYVFPSGV